jgi:hypothetical protein
VVHTRISLLYTQSTLASSHVHRYVFKDTDEARYLQ